jgi:alpha-tubulin suppressor-like RCC1 family protein
MGQNGELGNGGTTDSSIPVAVSNLTGVTAISAGSFSTCAILSDTSVQCWGFNGNGELGVGNSTGPSTCNGSPCSPTPVAVPNVTGATVIAMGQADTCVVVSGGAVECWGFNADGELGYGMTSGPDNCSNNGELTCSATPVSVSNLTGATALSVGAASACAIVSGGAVDCWGYGGDGEVGNGMTSGSTTPVPVSNLSGVTAIASGDYHTCAIVSGAVQCWGSNQFGELGQDPSGPSTCAFGGCSLTPVAVSGLTGIAAVGGGESDSCAFGGSTVECWGYDALGELGNGTTTNSSTPGVVSAL